MPDLLFDSRLEVIAVEGRGAQIVSIDTYFGVVLCQHVSLYKFI